MKHPILAIVGMLVLRLGSSEVYAETLTADEVIQKAKATAATNGRAIYVHFGASWCGWCRRLDAYLEQPDVKPVFEKYFVAVKLVVQENETNKALENPGAALLLKKLNGAGAGLPYSAFLDAHGTLIVASRLPSKSGLPGENIGYPGAPEEIDWFLKMVKQASPAITAADLAVLEQALKAKKP